MRLLFHTLGYSVALFSPNWFMLFQWITRTMHCRSGILKDVKTLEDLLPRYVFLRLDSPNLLCRHRTIRTGGAILQRSQIRERLIEEFRDIRYHFNSRYIRLRDACDREGNRVTTCDLCSDDIVVAAWENSLGVHALVWLTQQVIQAKQNLSSLNIPVTVSELAYGYQERGGAQDVLDAVEFINIHMLPFFSQNASTVKNTWPLVLNDLDWFIEHRNGKKMYFDK
ncbi:glycoside hydrolase family 17 protein, partial [Neolentinus lepideus HHB14362 ss-1]